MKSLYILKAFSTISNRVPLATPAADYTLQNKISISGVSGLALCHRASWNCLSLPKSGLGKEPAFHILEVRDAQHRKGMDLLLRPDMIKHIAFVHLWWCPATWPMIKFLFHCLPTDLLNHQQGQHKVAGKKEKVIIKVSLALLQPSQQQIQLQESVNKKLGLLIRQFLRIWLQLKHQLRLFCLYHLRPFFLHPSLSEAALPSLRGLRSRAERGSSTIGRVVKLWTNGFSEKGRWSRIRFAAWPRPDLGRTHDCHSFMNWLDTTQIS